MRKIFTILSLLFILCSFDHNPAVTYFFHGTFEDGSASVSGALNQNCPGLDCTMPCNSIVDTARLGTKAIKSQVYKTDPLTGGSHRCESLIIRDTSLKHKFYALSFYPRDWVPDQSNGLIMQFYQGGSSVYKPIGAVWLKSDPTNSYLYLQYVRQVDTVNANMSAPRQTTFILPRINTNQWTDLAFEIDWQSNYTGYIKIYINGSLYTTINGANTNKPFNPSAINWPNFRFGYYWFGYTTSSASIPQRTIYYDEVKEGNSLMSISDFLINPVLSVYAGADQSIQLPTASVHFTANPTGGNGAISYLWTKLSGPTGGNIVSPTNVQTDVLNLTTGAYQYRVRATDGSGSVAYDTVQVSVLQATNPPPVANAGNDTTITLPANTANLNAGLSTDDGAIVSYLWTKISGPSGGTIASATSVSTTVSGLIQGTYVYSVLVTDNFGGTNTDTKQIIVNPAIPPANIAPVANAGSATTITLPTSTAPLNATSSTDADGIIVAYLWTKISGPSASITSSTSSVTTATGLVAGSYVFRVRVTDNIGDTGVATKTVTVLPEPIPVLTLAVTGTNVTCNGGANASITATATGGQPYIHYTWLKDGVAIADTTTSLSSRSIGIYTVTATDRLGSAKTASLQITQPSGVVVTATPAGEITTVLGTTSVTVTATGGTGSYTSGTGTFNQGIGTMVYTVTDAAGCTGTDTVTLTLQAPPALTASASVTNVDCFGNTSGVINVTVSSGTAPYTFFWDDSSTTEDRSNIMAGLYTVIITDAALVKDTLEVNITEPPQLIATASLAATNSSNKAVITVSAEGGTPSYTNTGNFTVTGGITYNYTVTDANGCNSNMVTVIVPVYQPPGKAGQRFKFRNRQ